MPSPLPLMNRQAAKDLPNGPLAGGQVSMLITFGYPMPLDLL